LRPPKGPLRRPKDGRPKGIPAELEGVSDGRGRLEAQARIQG